MTVRELITKLLDGPMDKEVLLYCEKEHIDGFGEKCSGYRFRIDDMRNGEIMFTDWRDNEEIEDKTCNQTIENLKKLKSYHNGSYGADIDKAIKALEQVTWIPCDERQPKESGNYWCTFGGTGLTGSDYFTTKEDAKEIFDAPEEYIGWRSQNVIAWMPSPEPYKAKSGRIRNE